MSLEQKVVSYEDLQKLLKVIESCVTLRQLEVAEKMKRAYFKKHPWVGNLEYRADNLLIAKRKKLKQKFDYRWC